LFIEANIGGSLPGFITSESPTRSGRLASYILFSMVCLIGQLLSVAVQVIYIHVCRVRAGASISAVPAVPAQMLMR
jgi:hypothetical protein